MNVNNVPVNIGGGVAFTPTSGWTFSEGACYRNNDLIILEGCLTVPTIPARTWYYAGTFNVNIEGGVRTMAFRESGTDRIYVESEAPNAIKVFNAQSSSIIGSFYISITLKITQ